VDLLEPEAVDDALVDLAWTRLGGELVKVHRGPDFASSMAYANAVGALAEEMDHHPDIEIRWNEVTLHLSTHSAGGITALDIELARRIDALA